MDDAKAFGVITAIGKRVGEAARASGTTAAIDRVRAAEDAAALVAIARETSGLPERVLDDFAAYVAAGSVGKIRAQIVLQAKMHAAGAKPAPGHESGRGAVTGKK